MERVTLFDYLTTFVFTSIWICFITIMALMAVVLIGVTLAVTLVILAALILLLVGFVVITVPACMPAICIASPFIWEWFMEKHREVMRQVLDPVQLKTVIYINSTEHNR